MSRLARFRFLLALPALAALACGVLSGLARLGVAVPAHAVPLINAHGALMVGSFFGTVIGLERAVALGRGWPYLAPLLSGLAVPAMVLAPPAAAPAMMVAASLVLTLACFVVWREQREAHLATIAAGSLAWLLGNLVWARDAVVLPAVPLWTAFLILTIAGERLELSRYMPTPAGARRAFVAIAATLVATAAAGAFEAGALRAYGASLVALAAWLLAYDIARRTVRAKGLTRYMALCLLSGYAWLAVAGLLGAAGAFDAGHALRDAALHALMLGFVFAMVFGHAPVIFPAITRIRMHWHAGFYAPLAVLHATVIARIAAGLSRSVGLRQDAALGNAVALVLFLATVASSVVAARRVERRRGEARRVAARART